MISSASKATFRISETHIRTRSLDCCLASASFKKHCIHDNWFLRDSTWSLTVDMCEIVDVACSMSSSVSFVTTVDTATSAIFSLILWWKMAVVCSAQ